ncbi:tripartite tricarboxylate transporter substrate binding protein [Acuticoccus sp. M5D2P5]|uniref:Bug family tripartite tricarboxylate transporter substrate binding protein n=1 Tax=Acuticoccus kalidii TaxID=2910977 RepID=UPI001F2194C2|nr:tripartite tricarboxylate transporter substrate binding protein [Acuticoccus kalidii]MCF3935379.1 tripartite tricarboxylate transporter substrate binding protein [Acuticoccus kalidii]
MMKSITKRALMAGCAFAFAAGIVAGPAAAQDFPDGPITLVVNWPAGGGGDRAGRLLAQYGEKYAGVPIVVNNIDGAGGSTGVRFVAEAEPDGQTVGIFGSSIVAQQYINPNAPAVADLAPISFFGPDPGALEVRADTGIETLEQFIAALKENPGSIKNGNDAPGGWSYVVAALIEKAADVQMTKVPYKGYSPTVAAIMSGEIQSATLPVPQLVDQAKAGDINILAVTADERHFMAPETPTFKEEGIDLVAGDWRAVFAPAGVSDEVKAKLEEIFTKTVEDPEFQEAAKNVGFVIQPKGAEETGTYIAAFDENYYPVLLDAGLVKANQK